MRWGIVIGLLLLVVGVSSGSTLLGAFGFWAMVFVVCRANNNKIWNQLKTTKVKDALPPLKISIGISLLGLIIMLVGFALDTTVATDTDFGRVHNIGLMQQQRNTMMFGGLLFLGGILVWGFSHINNKNR